MAARTPHLRVTSSASGALLLISLSAVALVGCVPAAEAESPPAAETPPVDPPEDSPAPTQEPAKTSDCVVVPARVLHAVDEILVNSGDSVPFAASWYDEEAKLGSSSVISRGHPAKGKASGARGGLKANSLQTRSLENCGHWTPTRQCSPPRHSRTSMSLRGSHGWKRSTGATQRFETKPPSKQFISRELKRASA